MAKITHKGDLAMINVAETWVAACLPQNESAVTVRPIQPNDGYLIDEMYWRLSSETVYFRYFEYGIPQLAEIEQLCRIAPEQGAGFVATVENQGEVAVGIAYYRHEGGSLGRDADQTVEFNLLVEAQYQMQGVVRRLWQHIHDHAKAHHSHTLELLFSPTSQRIWLQGPRIPPASSQE
jgi:hypothetical protein